MGRHELARELRLMTDDPASERPRPVERRFLQVLDALEGTHARCALCGAVAMGAHGALRNTEDIDVLVAAEDLERVVSALQPQLRVLRREPAEGPPKQVRMRARRARTRQAVDVDLLVPVDVVEAWALATAVPARTFKRKVEVASPEALVVMKLQAYLSDPESSAGGKHRVDAMTLLETLPIDVPGVRRFVRSHPALAEALERALAAPRPRGR